MAVTKVLHVNDCYPGGPDRLAEHINNQYNNWRSARTQWEREKMELRNYVFATDTTKTTNSQLPWKNTTTTPKLAQLRDNLHANYMAALFPSDNWFDWIAEDQASATKKKADTIKAFLKQKLAQTNFEEEVSKLVLDYIDYGNAFGQVEYVEEYHEAKDGSRHLVYSGPRLTRISPTQIVFDVTSRDFETAPKITRALYTIGDLERIAATQPAESGWVPGAIKKMKEARFAYSQAMTENSQQMVEGLMVDGFGNLNEYYSSGYIEVLEFEGDLYDLSTNTYLPNHRVVVGDQKVVLYKAPFESWLGRSNKKHVGWRLRPDNLMAMGPLDNLVGIQYRIDHLENLQADVFDQIAHPVVYERGHVEEWVWGPGEKIKGDAESEVTVLAPDATALGARFEIAEKLALMEEMAGAPKTAMGIRTPGEKTAYEVQSLENAAGRIFQMKVRHFEKVFLEQVLNAMLECARRNLNGVERISEKDDNLGAILFREVSAEDLKAKGQLRPMGARHFAEKAQLVQNINALMSSNAWADQGIRSHFSGLGLAKMFEDLLGAKKYKLVSENVQVAEALDTRRQAQAAEDTAAMESGVSTETAGVSPESMAMIQSGIPPQY